MVRLVLEVQEAPASIRYRDPQRPELHPLRGQWTLREQDGHALIGYELLAEPGFDVPAFILTRLLARDARRMIERLQAEIAARRGGGRPALTMRPLLGSRAAQPWWEDSPQRGECFRAFRVRQ